MNQQGKGRGESEGSRKPGVVGGTEKERAKAGTTRKANSVMIPDERKGSRGRGVTAGGGESGSERKMGKRRKGEGERDHLKAK